MHRIFPPFSCFPIRFFLAVLAFTAVLPAFAQSPALAKLHLDNGELDKAKQGIDEAAASEKYAPMPKTWVYRGMIYQGIAQQQLDASDLFGAEASALVAYDSYARALLLDPQESESKRSLSAGSAFSALLSNIGRGHFGACAAMEEAVEEEDPLFDQHLAGCVRTGELAYSLDAGDTTALILAFLSADRLGQSDAIERTGTEVLLHPDIREKVSYAESLAHYYYFTAGNRDMALRVSTFGINAGSSSFLVSLAVEILDEEQRYDEAIDWIHQHLVFYPTDAGQYFSMGVLYERMGQQESALQAYDRAIAIDGFPDAVYNAGAMLFNDAALKIQYLNNLSEEEYAAQSGTLQEEVRRSLEQCRPYFERLHRLQPTERSHLDVLISVYELLGLGDEWHQAKQKRAALGN